MDIDIYKLAKNYKLTESEELALKYIVNNFDNSLKIGVRGVARECFASTSVVMNLAKKLGYNGFIDLVYNLKFNMKNKIAQENREDKKLCLNLDDEKIKKFRAAILDKRQPVFVLGAGFSRYIVEYMGKKLMVLGYHSMFSEYLETMERKEGDGATLLVVSKSGETSHLVPILTRAKEHGVNIVLFTGCGNSKLGDLSNIVFQIKDSNPSDDRNLGKNDYFANVMLFFEELIGEE